MPQEFQVLQCYSCDCLQVHIVKKVTKWACNMCGEKQSVKKVFARGNGKDCRLHVQELNKIRIKQTESAESKNRVYDLSTPEPYVCNDVKNESKWTEFLQNDESNCEEEIHIFSNIEKKQIMKIHRQSCEESNIPNKISKWSEFGECSKNDNVDTSAKENFSIDKGNSKESTEKVGKYPGTRVNIFEPECNDLDSLLRL